MDDSWQPRTPFPLDTVRPVATRGSGGDDGPTRGQARGASWRRTGRGLYVPIDTDLTPEQRIVEVAAGLPPDAMLTGWAALRLQGGGFFDGRDSWRKLTPVPVLADADQRLRSDARRRVVRDRMLPLAVTVAGVRCAPPARAAIDAMRLADDGRDATVVFDMALAAGVVSVPEVLRAWDQQIRRVGAAMVRFGIENAHPESRSPAETRLRLIWTLDARLPPPLLNREVCDRDGRLVGIPDLLEPHSGLAAEYDGSLHRDRDRHRRDNLRRERFLEAGLVPVTVVAGEQRSEVVRRLRAAYRRAVARPAADDGWMLASEERSAPRSA
jgi:hypothetical protein